MRIAHIVERFLPISTTFIYTQLLAQRELEQGVFARTRENATLFPFAPVHIDRLTPLGRPIWSRLPTLVQLPDIFPRRLVRPIRQFRPDVLHAHFGWTGVAACHAARELDLPLVVAFHGRDVYSPASKTRNADVAYRDMFALGAAFTCVGPIAGAELQRLGCPPDRLAIVPVGIDLEAFPFAPAKLQRPLTVIQVARLVEKKGIDITIRAFARARRRLGDSQLLIVGDGPERSTLEALVGELAVSDCVRFLGMVSPSSVTRLMERAHIGVQPSRIASDGDREGTPTVIIEMQARGIPVVATRHTDIPFIVPFPSDLIAEDHIDGLAEQLIRLAELTPAERAARLVAARDLVERQHDAREIAMLLRRIYEAAVQRSFFQPRQHKEMRRA